MPVYSEPKRIGEDGGNSPNAMPGLFAMVVTTTASNDAVKIGSPPTIPPTTTTSKDNLMARKAKKQIKKMKGRKRGGASVPCPTCSKNSRVIITRRDGDSVVRTRKCLGSAGHVFSTTESVT